MPDNGKRFTCREFQIFIPVDNVTNERHNMAIKAKGPGTHANLAHF